MFFRVTLIIALLTALLFAGLKLAKYFSPAEKWKAVRNVFLVLFCLVVVVFSLTLFVIAF